MCKNAIIIILDIFILAFLSSFNFFSFYINIFIVLNYADLLASLE